MLHVIGNIFKIAFANEISVAKHNKVGIMLYFKTKLSPNRPICCIFFVLLLKGCVHFRMRRERVTKLMSHSGRRVCLKKKGRS